MRPASDSAIGGTTYDAGNHFTIETGSSIAYDNNGNLVTITGTGANTFIWNARDQLSSTGKGTILAYDAIGRLVSKTESGTTATYIYDGIDQVVSAGNFILRGAGPDEVYAQVTSGTATSYLTDALGSVMMLTSPAGVVTTSYSYGPYGTTQIAGSADTQYKFAGALSDQADGIYYYRSRYYSPQLARFISEDPIELGGGLNFYSYASGNPISNIDPLGLWDFPSLPQGVVNGVTGFGDGAYNAITLGFGNLQDIRDVAGINGGVDACSSAYKVGHVAGEIDGAGALAGSLAAQSFSRGGWLNSNRYLRIGWGKDQGYEVFRISGNWIGDHIDLFRGPRL